MMMIKTQQPISEMSADELWQRVSELEAEIRGMQIQAEIRQWLRDTGRSNS